MSRVVYALAAVLVPQALIATSVKDKPSKPTVGALCRQLQHGTVSARRHAAMELGRLGAKGADCLVYAVRKDADPAVQSGSLGLPIPGTARAPAT